MVGTETILSPLCVNPGRYLYNVPFICSQKHACFDEDDTRCDEGDQNNSMMMIMTVIKDEGDYG